MKHWSVVQGSEEWLRLRLGKPTASEFSRILTPAKLELAAGRKTYAIELLTEMILDGPLDGVTTPAMLHGKDWEPKARAAYEMQEGVDVEDVGFCTTEDGRVGASPDAFVGEDGSLEIKCPEKPEVHVRYLLNPDYFKSEHNAQVQGQLYVTGRKWTDLVSYFMGIPMVKIRIEPDARFQAALASALETFLKELDELRIVAQNRGVKFPEDRKAPAPDHSADLPTHEEVDYLASVGGIVPQDGRA
jgi:YqaJ-like viral recombinase domain